MFKKGQLLLLEQGAYSSFGYAGPFTVLKDFEKAEAVSAFTADSGLETNDRDEHAFVAWLARNGYIADADTQYWFLGDYGFLPLDFVETLEETSGVHFSYFDRLRTKKTPEAQAKEDAENEIYRAKSEAFYLANPNTVRMTTATASTYKVV